MGSHYHVNRAAKIDSGARRKLQEAFPGIPAGPVTTRIQGSRKPKRPLSPAEIREVLSLVKLCVSQRRPHLRRMRDISITWDRTGRF